LEPTVGAKWLQLLKEIAPHVSRVAYVFSPNASPYASLDRLPPDTKLEPVAVTADGHDLDKVRNRIRAALNELEALRRAPAPSEDIEARVRNYVRGLAPKVRGVGVGERLSIVWPGAQTASQFISEHTCDPLSPPAAHRRAGARAGRAAPRGGGARGCRDHGRSARPPLPIGTASSGAWRQGRGQSFARRLMGRLSGQQRIEVAIVVATGAPRQAGCPPWIVLGVEATEAPGVRAA